MRRWDRGQDLGRCGQDAHRENKNSTLIGTFSAETVGFEAY
jgi:hypothetical protein